VPLLLLATLACSSSLEPRSGVTLLVTNGTCQAGQCTPLAILGFPSNQPITPGGLWSIDLGLLTVPAACLTFPRSAIFRVIGVSNDGTKADTTTYTWTTALPLSLGALEPPASRLWASPSTAAFVPASAPSWIVNLPAGSHVSPRQACSP
jgi:hypothetical protein